MHKNIIITESQYKRLFEAAMDTFSLQELSNIPTFRGRMEYCKQQLGPAIGKGSGRMVFQIDDEKVLKLAMNQKGIAQNNEERPDSYKNSMSLFPKCYEIDENKAWLVAEYVLPAKAEDIRKVTGMSPKEFFNVVYNLWHERQGYNRRFNIWGYRQIDKDKLWGLVEDYDSIFYEINDYLGNYDGVGVGDLVRLSSWGLAMRGGEPYLVILDSGLTSEVYNSYYRRL